jgi:hypothetical protein
MYICCISRENELHLISFKYRDRTLETVCGEKIRDNGFDLRSLQLISMGSNSSLVCGKCKNNRNHAMFIHCYKNKAAKNSYGTDIKSQYCYFREEIYGKINNYQTYRRYILRKK